MAKKIGIRLYLDGASKFNSDVKNCNASLKQFQSELKRNKEEYKGSENSIDALAKKSESLNKAYETAGKKVELYAKRLEELAKARQAEAQKLQTYHTALEEEKKKLAEIEATSGKTSAAYEQQAKTISDLEKKITVTGSAMQRMDTEAIKLNTSMNNAATEQLKYGSELDKTNGYLAEAERSADGCAKSIDQFGRSTEEASDHLEKIDNTLQAVAQNAAFEKLGEGAKALLDSLLQCAEVAEKFEYSMAKVQSIAQVSDGSLGKMSAEIRRVSTEMGYGANEIAEATYQAISASVDAADSVQFVEDTTKLARAGFTEVTTAVDVLTTAINAYGQEANTTAHISDDLITTQNLGKTTVDELAESMGTIIPTAAAYNISLDQLSSAYVILTKQGINTANATTYLSGMFSELGDNGSKVSETLYDMSGHTFGELMKAGYSLGDVLEMLGQSVDGNTEQFANLFGNIRAGRGALAIFNQGAEAFNTTLEAMENNAGATDKAFATMADTAEMVNQRFSASVENLQMAIGESLSPTLAAMKEGGIDLLETITNIVEENPQLVAAVAGGSAAVAGLAVAATGAAAAVALLRIAFGDVSAVAVLTATGVAAATGAIAGIALASQGSADETDHLVKSLNDSAEAGRELSKSVDDTVESQKKHAEYVDTLVERVKTLNAEENLSEDQKHELRSAVEDLNAAIGETVAEIDEQTNHLSDNTEQWITNLEAQEKAAEVAELQAKLNDVIREKADIDYQVWEVTQQINEAQAERAQLEEELLAIHEKGILISTEEFNRSIELETEIYNLKMQEEDLAESKQNLIDVSGTLSEKESELKDYTSDIATATGEATTATDEYTSALGIMYESATAAAEADKKVEEAIAGATAAISEQIGIFDEWNEKSSLTFDEMQTRWQEQTDGIEQYKEDLAYVKGVIDSDTNPAISDLAENMVNMGANGAAELHEFVEGLKSIGDNTEAMEELAETWQEHIDALSEAEGIYASITLQEQNYTAESQALFEEFYANSETAQQEYNDAMVQMAEQGVSDQATAISSTAPEVETATKNMAEGAVQAAYDTLGVQRGGGTSTIFYNMGKNVDESLAKGIKDNSGVVASAMREMAQKAVDSVDLSGVAEKLNRKLGEAMQ